MRLAALDIKLAHSVFALPFAILGAFLASPALRAGAPASAWRSFAGQGALVVACMVCARTWAMLVNRLADREFDSRNARTSRRVIASGALPLARSRAITLGAALAFIASCAGFLAFDNAWPLYLCVPVLAWVALYSFTKRFTALCHVFLGGALGISPLAAAIAVNPGALRDTPALFWIAGFVVMWVAGFDVLYAIQDLEFDRHAGLHSIPARLGLRGAVWTGRGLHAAALLALALAWRAEARLGVLFGVGVGLVGVLLVAEHAVVAVRGRSGIPMAFFTINGVVSCVLGVAGCLELAHPWANP